MIRRTLQEVPHAVEVMVEEIERPRVDLARVRALIWVESDSQKGIVVGAGGRMIKAIGTAARGSSSASWAARCTWICRCACAGIGAPMTDCWIAWASRSSMRRMAGQCMRRP